jgi:DNA-binding LacI/PurR family transcriptional regulator
MMARTTPPRRVRLDDVAAAAGVSSATVSLVLRGVGGPSAATRQRVSEAAARLGYRPDRAASVLASRRSRLIGVALDISNPFHTRLVRDAYGAAHRHGYHLILSTVAPDHDERQAVETLLDSRCEGLVLLGPTAPVSAVDRIAASVPVVLVGRHIDTGTVDVVRTDDGIALESAVGHLAALGHRRIAHVDGGRGEVAALRRRAYRAAMRRHGFAGEIRVLGGGDTEAAGAAAAEVLSGGLLPTAVVAFNDRSAIGLVDALARAGAAVPTEVSVIGYDDSPVARLGSVDLTTIGQDTARLTEDAILMLIERLEGGRTAPREVVVAPHLVVGSTTGPPPGP